MKTYSEMVNLFQAEVEVFEDILDRWEEGEQDPRSYPLDLELLWQQLPGFWTSFRGWLTRVEKDLFAKLEEVQKDEHRRARDDLVPRIHRIFDRTKALADDLKADAQVDILGAAAMKPYVEAFDRSRREIVAMPVGPDAFEPEPRWER